MQVSSAFVVIMGMGVTFVGLTCIIFLTMLMGRFNFEFHFFLYQRKGRHRAVLFATMKKIFDLAQN